MKSKLLPLLLLSALFPGCALFSEDKGASPAAAPTYMEEAPLPEGWPQPGPFNQVTEKKYPAYRAAFTAQSMEFTGFWTLFTHIKKNNIPMTAPVEIAVEPKEEGKGMKQTAMGFLYQKDTVGQPGPDGQAVTVKDIPAASALSYACQGGDQNENTAKARAALELALAEKKLTAQSFRLLGYNGPNTPAAKRTWELQALIK